MKTFRKYAAQGDLLIIQIDEFPDNLKRQVSEDQYYTIAHSETGHHHVVYVKDTELFHSASNDDMIIYLAVNNETELKHLRSFDTHESIKIPKGKYEIHRQREYTPRGWRRIED